MHGGDGTSDAWSARGVPPASVADVARQAGSAESAGTIGSGPTEGRGRPRHRLLVAVAVAAGLVAAWLVTTPAPAERLSPTQLPVPAPLGGAVRRIIEAGVFDMPARGSLGTDDDFVEAVRQLPWIDPDDHERATRPDAGVDGRRVAFAGDVPGGRVALVVGRERGPDQRANPSSDSLAHVWFTGPPGARAAQMRPAGPPRRGPAERPRALVDRHGMFILVTAPGDRVAVSERPELAADGSRERTWTAADAPDGVVVLHLGGPAVARESAVPPHRAVAYRVVRDGTVLTRAEPEFEPVRAANADLRLAWARPPTGRGAAIAETAGVDLLARLGSTDVESDVTAHWAGPVPGIRGATAAVLTVTTSSGALVVRAGMQVPIGHGVLFDVVCGVEVRAAGGPPTMRTYAAACNVPDLTRKVGARSHLLVVAPPEVASVRMYDGYGNYLEEHAATDGVLLMPRPTGTTAVEGVTRGGVLLGRSRLMAVDIFLRN